MARKENRAYFTENDTFATRLKEAMAFRGLNQTHLEQKILNEQGYTMQRQTISQYLRGISRPDTERLTVLCKALDVSADYLLGFTEIKTNNKDLQFVCNYTGLSEKVINQIRRLVINEWGEPSSPELDMFLSTKGATSLFLELMPFRLEINRGYRLLSTPKEENFFDTCEPDFFMDTIDKITENIHDIRYAEFCLSERFAETIQEMFSSNELKKKLDAHQEKLLAKLHERAPELFDTCSGKSESEVFNA